MSRTIAVIAAAVVFIIATASGLSLAASADSCGGGCPTLPKNFRAVSITGAPLAYYYGGSPNALTATLAKGKKKTVLVADGLLTENASNLPIGVSRIYALGISVNGLVMHPSDDFGPGSADQVEDCGISRSDPDAYCMVVGHWWLDMDDPANAALIGVPIAVTLVGGDTYGGPAVGAPVDVSLRVRLEKK